MTPKQRHFSSYIFSAAPRTREVGVQKHEKKQKNPLGLIKTNMASPFPPPPPLVFCSIFLLRLWAFRNKSRHFLSFQINHSLTSGIFFSSHGAPCSEPLSKRARRQGSTHTRKIAPLPHALDCTINRTASQRNVRAVAPAACRVSEAASTTGQVPLQASSGHC
jgi:hypothetical protein